MSSSSRTTPRLNRWRVLHNCRTGVARRPSAEVEAEAEGEFLDTQLARLGCDEHARQLVVTLEFRAGGSCGREARFSRRGL